MPRGAFELTQIIREWKPVEHLRQLVRESEPVFLVGGAVRDLFLSRGQPHDLDVVMLCDVRPLARRLASALEGDFYMLDDERNTARVLYRNEQQGVGVIDFARARGGSLEEDLLERDFTVNALALGLKDLDAPQIIDPCGGVKDLHAKVLRPCREDAFEADPIRVLRGVRLALNLGFRLAPEAWQAMKDAAPRLAIPSAERRRDEIFRIFDGQHVSSALRLLDQAGALDVVFPELTQLKGVRQTAPHHEDVWNHTLSTLDELEKVLAALAGRYNESLVSNLRMGLAVLHLGAYREELTRHFGEEITQGRRARELLFLSALYHDTGKPAVVQQVGERMRFFEHEIASAELAALRGKELALSQHELARVRSVVRAHMRVHHLAQSGGRPSPRAVYRFFRDTGSAGVDVCLLSLADTLATHRPDVPPAVWKAELEVCQTLLEAWWQKKDEVISPPRLINGQDVLAAGVPAGPVVGSILEAATEAQVEGRLQTREEALQFICDWLGKGSKDEERNGKPGF